MHASTSNVLAMVLAGGAGERIRPLTDQRAKPAVPFGGAYRIIDFVITNLYNSGVYKIAILTQYKPDSLNRHVRQGYLPVFGSSGHSYLEMLPPIGAPYQGTADAVYHHLERTRHENFDVTDVFGADHIYRMNVAQMHDSHLSKGADATVSVMPVGIDVAQGQLGVVVVDKEGRIINFEEKPANPTPMPEDDSKCLISMGNYSFKPKSLEEALRHNPKDFGREVFPQMVGEGKRVFAYDFLQNTIEGFRPKDVVYWRDVGTLEQFYEAHMDLLGENPILRLQHQKWRMLTNIEVPEPSRVTGCAVALDFILANGAWIHDDATVRGSVMSYGVEVLKGANVTGSILMGYNVIGEGSLITNTIMDRGVKTPPKTVTGNNVQDDLKRGFKVVELGPKFSITVVPRGYEFQ